MSQTDKVDKHTSPLLANEAMAVPSETGGKTETVAVNADFSKLSALADLNEVVIKQPIRRKELLCELCCGCEVQNLYTIQKVDAEAKTAEPLYVLKEDSNFCLRQWYDLHNLRCIYSYK